MRAHRFTSRRLSFEILESRITPSAIGKVLATPTVATTSSNWSGYAALTSLQSPQSGAVSAVSANWTVPSVSGSGTAYSSVWAGIDGFSSRTVEQIGTEQDLYRGTPIYTAWYEMYPQEAEIPIASVTIAPGDAISASVTYSTSSGAFTLSISDLQNGEQFTTTQTSPAAQRSSAEWIVEAPSAGRILPLANFGTVTITNASATLNGTTGPIDSSAWANASINMTSHGTTEASTGPLTDTTTNPATSKFTVTYTAVTTTTHSSAPSPSPRPPQRHQTNSPPAVMTTATVTFVPVIPPGPSSATVPGLSVNSVPFVSPVQQPPTAAFLVNTTVPTPAPRPSNTGGNEFDAPDLAPAGGDADANPGQAQQPAPAGNQTSAELPSAGWLVFRAGDPLAAPYHAEERFDVIDQAAEVTIQKPHPSLAVAAGMLLFLAGGLKGVEPRVERDTATTEEAARLSGDK